MIRVLIILATAGLLPASAAFSVGGPQANPQKSIDGVIDRRQSLAGIGASIFGAAVFSPSVARADVSEGNALPQGAAQFARVVRLQSDIKKVQKRVAEGADEMDKAEWANISQFLRQAYSTGEDMKAIAAGVYNPENKQRALNDIDQLKKFTQAADLSVNKKDGPGFVGIADKMEFLVSDFLDSLSDVPDEI